MSFENFADRCPGTVIALFAERILDGDLNVIGEDGEKDVRLDTMFQMMEDGTFGQGAFQVAESLFDSRQEDIYPPRFFGVQINPITA